MYIDQKKGILIISITVYSSVRQEEKWWISSSASIGGCQFSYANKFIYYLPLITTAGTGAQGLRAVLLLVRAFRAHPFLIF